MVPDQSVTLSPGRTAAATSAQATNAAPARTASR
jgi:hypothetical protein